MSPPSPRYRPPDSLPPSALVGRADRYAFAAYEGRSSRGMAGIDHPRAVAALLVTTGADDEIIAAGLLHDVLEDTTVTRAEVEDEFGARIAGLVAALSEDASIEVYATRKAQLRQQVADAGAEAAAIFLADKLARLQALERSRAPIEPHKLEHYRATLEILSRAHPRAPLIAQVSEALGNVAGD